MEVCVTYPLTTQRNFPARSNNIKNLGMFTEFQIKAQKLCRHVYRVHEKKQIRQHLVCY